MAISNAKTVNIVTNHEIQKKIENVATSTPYKK